MRIDSEKNNPNMISIIPSNIMDPPVRAPNAYWATNPPEPWHKGIPPKKGFITFINPILKEREFASTSLSGNKSLIMVTVAIITFVKVRNNWAIPANTIPINKFHISGR